MSSSIGFALDHHEQELFDRLYATWKKRRPGNVVKTVYMDGEAALKDFGISLPPQMRSITSALGWTAKGVRAVTDRSRFEGFVSGSGENFGVDEIAFANDFAEEFPAAKVSSAVHGCSFLSVTQGDVASGEPSILILPRAADLTSAIWDSRRRQLAGVLSVTDVDKYGSPTGFVLLTPDKAVTMRRVERVWAAHWTVEVVPNPLGRVPVVPVVYGKSLMKPLGTSRVTHASRGYVDSALRTIVRSEVSAEFYSAPEYWLFGAEVADFVGNDRWTAVMGRVKALDVDPDDPKHPTLHRFEGSSPQPHADQLRMWANLFADDQDLEVKFADSSNPSSADAIFAAKETLITTTENANKAWGSAAVKAMRYALMLRDGVTELPAEMNALAANHTDPAIVSPTARADAFVKLASAIDGFGVSEVGMQYAGLSAEQITRFHAEVRRNGASSRIDQLVQAVRDSQRPA